MVELLADFRTWPVPGGGARTILLTTHQAALAKPLANNILTMRNGQILDSLGQDSPRETEATAE
jgi:ABC-type multidrug transport system ATPase subunit